MKMKLRVLNVFIVGFVLSFLNVISTNAAAYPQIMLNVPYYPQKVQNDCAIPSIAMIEAAEMGYGVNDFDYIYNAVLKDNNNSLDGGLATRNGKYVDITKSDSAVYEQLKQGKPVLIYRTGSSAHWSVIVGYKGNTDRLERSGFVVYKTARGGTVGKPWEERLDSFLSGYTWTHAKVRAKGILGSQYTSSFPLTDGVIYKITNVGSGKVMDVPAGRNEDSLQIIQQGSNNSAWQRWKAVKHTYGYSFINIHTGKALDIYNGSTSSGANLTQYTYNASAAQRFKLVDKGNGNYAMIGFGSSMALTVPGSSTSDGTGLVQKPFEGGSNQLWTFRTVDLTPPSISDITVTNIDATGFTVNCIVTDNVGVTRVSFPTWTEYNGQDDLASTWPVGTNNNGLWSYRVNISEHNNEGGKYIVHIYAYDADGNVSPSKATSAVVVKEKPLTDFALNTTQLSLAVGERQSVYVTVYNPEDTTSNKTATWLGGDPNVVTVDADGTVVAHNVGQTTIKCIVAGITKEISVSVSKKTGPDAPTGLSVVKTSSQGAADGKITGVNATMEYSTSADFKNTVLCNGDTISGLKAGTYYVRVAETSTTLAGSSTMVVIEDGIAKLKGTVTISGELKFGKTIKAVVSKTNNTGTLSYKWKRGSSVIKGATKQSYKLVKEDIGQTITCVVTSSNESSSISGKTASAIEKADGPGAPTGLSSVAATQKGKADGKIKGVNTTMEYATKTNFSNAKACTGTTITKLKAATYYVRIAETETTKAGSYKKVVVKDGPEPTPVVKVTDIFDDVKSSDWFVDAVQYVYDKGIMSGQAANLFKPNNALTRAEAITVLFNFEGKPKTEYYARFSDVSKGQWYSEPITWGYNSNIVSGYPDGSYGINDKVTREQFALMLYKYASMKGKSIATKSNVLAGFADKNRVDTWAKEAMEWAVSQGIMSGKPVGNSYILDPEGNATRAECASMMMKFAALK